VVHRSPLPSLAAPYIAGLVEVEEGPWLLTRLLTAPEEELAFGSVIQIYVVPGPEEGEALVLSCTPAFSTHRPAASVEPNNR
jgi:uncharacterized OB-fold protein